MPIEDAPQPTEATSNIPTPVATIGRFRLGAKIGAGGMGEVYSATDPDLGRRVAIKLLPEALAADDQYKARLKREAHAAARLSHPNIVTIHEMGEHEGRPYIVMEHVEGQTLHDLVARGPLEMDRVLEIAQQLGSGLHKAHEQGVIHRDIKSSNIIVEDEGRARILDFGLAVVSGGLRMTQPGSSMGTPMYMSPEQVEGREVDARSDLFALGVVLYELLTGTCPFERASKSETVAAVLGATPEPISNARPETPAALAAIVEHLLAKDPSQRYGSAREMLEDLAPLRGGTQTVSIKSAHPKRPSLAPIMAAVIFLVAGVVISVVALRPNGLAPPSGLERKLVVLPFENLGPESEAVVAMAITEEITNQLSAVSELQVISRTTARRYAKTDREIDEIAQELGVTHVLEGSVTWGRGDAQSSRAQVSSRLIRVHDDTLMWQNSFDREMSDLFGVQREIAESVAGALASVLGGEDQSIGGTTNLEAQRLFTRGVEYLERPDPYIAQDTYAATELLLQAVGLDPNFARAWGELAMAHSSLMLWGHDRTASRLAMLEEAAQRAKALAPDLATSHIAMAQSHRCARSFEDALTALDEALALHPNNVRALIIKASILGNLGRHQEAEDEMRRALELNPGDSVMVHDIGDVYILPRLYPQADEFYERSISLAPNQVLAYACQAENHWLWRGDLEKGRELLSKMPFKSDPRSVRHLFRQELFARNFEAALAVMDAAPTDILKGPWWYLPVQAYRGQALHLLGRDDEAREAYEASIVLLERDLALEPEDDRILAALGHCYANLGRNEEAIAMGIRAIELVPYELDAHSGCERLHDLAHIYAAIGDEERALDLVERLLGIPAFITPNMLRIDPRWDPLRDNPRFVAIVEPAASSNS